MITNSITMNIKTVEESPNYNELNLKGENWKAVKATKAIVTKGGMKNGSPTVDIQMIDGKGNKYVLIITGKILRMITNQSDPLCDDYSEVLVN